jgi:hypothetical protein
MSDRELERVRATAGGSIRRIPLHKIDAIVTEHLGPARVRGNARPAVFYWQIAMYLAHRVGGCSTTAIGKFYNGRDHSTVCHAIARIELLRKSDQDLSAVIDLLANACEDEHASVPEVSRPAETRPLVEAVLRQMDSDFVDLLADRIAERVLARLTATTGSLPTLETCNTTPDCAPVAFNPSRAVRHD